VTLLALAVSGRGIVDPDAPAVFADDEAFLRGRGAFETVRVYGGRPFLLDAHLDRLEASAARLRLPPVDPEPVRALVEDALEASGEPDCVVRIYWTPGREVDPEPTAYVLVRDVPGDLEELRARGLLLFSVLVGEVSGLLGGVKSTSYALNMVAVDEARRRGADDALFLGSGGVVLECPTSNTWWRRDQTLFTPSLDLGILAGVTRGVVVEVATELGYEVAEGVYPIENLTAAEEAFTTSSVREVMPVVAVDDRPIAVGSAAKELQTGLRLLSAG